MSSLEKLQEKCGVIGLTSPTAISAAEVHAAWEPLQGRGLDTAGLVGRRGKDRVVVKQRGSISELFSPEVIESINDLGPQQVVAHNRYATFGAQTESNNQPIERQNTTYALDVAHNGNLPEKTVARLRSLLEKPLPSEASDTAVLTEHLLQERHHYDSWEATLLHCLPECEGAYSLIIVTEDGTMFAIKDPLAIRPLALGQKGEVQIAASESISFSAIAAEYLREMMPGEMRVYPPGKTPYSLLFADAQTAACALEYHYFSKPDTFDGRETMKSNRLSLGRGVAQRFLAKGIEIDIVVPILNSGLYVAEGFAAATQMPLEHAVKKNGKSNRTFILGTDQARTDAVHDKHIVDPSLIAGKNIALVDDSIVRGVSVKVGILDKIRQLPAEQRPASIHLVLGSPPLVNACDLGVAISGRSELFTKDWTNLSIEDLEVEAAKALGIDSVTFSTPEIVATALQRSNDELCTHCFGGQHPLKSKRVTYRTEAADELRKQKILFLASGDGTNVHALLQAVEEERVLAKPIGVITNNPEAGVKNRAAEFGVETQVVDSHGIPKKEQRATYMNDLLQAILNHPEGVPDVIVLAGWMLVLSDAFLEEMEKRGIAVLNIHPALLSGQGLPRVMTSRGSIPEIRGAHAIRDTLAHSLEEIPVGGVTVHYVKPGGKVDTGEVIVKQEVARRPERDVDFEHRIHETEYDIYPLALQKALLKRVAVTPMVT